MSLDRAAARQAASSRAHAGALRPDLQLRGGHPLPASPARIQPRRQEGHAADRLRAAVHGRGLSRRHRGLRGLDERPEDGGQSSSEAARAVRTRAGGAGGRPGDADGSAHPRGPAGCRGTALDHHAARTDHPQTRQRRHRDAVTVRRAGLGRGHQRRVPRRAAHRVPQSAAGRRTPAQARRAAGGHRGGPRAHRGRDPAREQTATRRGGHRRARRQGDQPLQDGQALRDRDHRRALHVSPQRGRRSRPSSSSTASTSSGPTSSRSGSTRRRRSVPTRTCRRSSARFAASSRST